MAKTTTSEATDTPFNTILMREIQTGDGIRRATSRQPETQESPTNDKNLLYAKEEEPYVSDSKEQTLTGEDIGSTKLDRGGSSGLKKWVERRWVWTIYGVMFLAGE